MRPALLFLAGFSGLVLLIELAFTGAGVALPGVGLSLRRLLFVVLMGSALLLRLAEDRSFTQMEAAFLAFLALLVGGWAWFMPSDQGYGVGSALADAGPWFAFAALAIWPWRAWSDPKRWRVVRRVVVVSGLLLAVLHIALWAALTTEVISYKAVSLVGAAITGLDAESEPFFRVSLLENGQVRIFWSSSIFMFACLYFLLAYRAPRTRLASALAIGIVMFALWTTHIRAFLGALVLAAGVTYAARWFYTERWPIRAPGFVLMCWTVGILLVVIAISPEVLAALGLGREVSDVERLDQSTALIGRFLASPLMGNGFGAFVPQVVRSEAAPFSYELVFHALLMKLGVLGLIVMLCIFWLALHLVQSERALTINRRAFTLWTGFTTGLWFAGATNPLVTNFVGMGVLMLLLLDLHQQSLPRREASPAHAIAR